LREEVDEEEVKTKLKAEIQKELGIQAFL
jgi:hypothetical protein